MNSFCLYHIEQFFLYHDPLKVRLDISLKNYFKSHRALGSKDRKILSSVIFSICRHLPLIRHLIQPTQFDQKTIQKILSLNLEEERKNPNIPAAIRYGFNPEFFEKLKKSFSDNSWLKFLDALYQEAPLFGRVNPLKTDRDTLLKELAPFTGVESSFHSPYGIRFHKRENFSTFPAFLEGKFEIQDENSQLAALALEAKPKERILDFCAGSGGKSLLIGALMENRGQLFLHDVRKAPLEEAKKRLRRAGIQNAQILPIGNIDKQYIGYFDRVLLDVPCSGTGTLRRNPDRKERLTVTELEELITLQRSIFKNALRFVKPQGKILWATCSVLKEENEEQIAFFCTHYPIKTVKAPFSALPLKGTGDGFFAQLLELV